MSETVEYVLVPLRGKRGNGKHTLVSCEDYELVKKYKWHVTIYGYAVTAINNTNISMHRLIMFQFQHDEDKIIDHADGNKLNNTRQNLRWCTYTENSANSKLASNNTSGIKGVSWNMDKGKWHASIRKNGQRINLGSYENIYDASQAYAKAAHELFGEFARPSIPLDRTELHNREVDSIETFINNEIDPDSKPNDRTSAEILYNRYLKYCEYNFLKPTSQAIFGASLGMKYKKGKDPYYRTVLYYGIKLKESSTSVTTF